MNCFVRLLTAALFLSLAIHGGPTYAQEAEPAIPVAQLREDLRVLRGALEESHVGLYWFISKKELERRFQQVSAALVRPMTVREFHRRLLPLVASLRHGHTTLTLPVEGVGYRLRHLSKAGKYFPFEVRVLQNRLYVVSDLSESADVAPGAEVIAINGRPVGTLLDKMRLYLSADGANDTFKMHQLGPGFQFHHLLVLLFGPSDTYRVDVLPLSGKAKIRRIVPAVSPERMVTLYRERTGREIDAYPSALRFRLLGDGAALLTVSSFYEGLIKPGEPSFEAFLASAFRQIKEGRVKDLIVDVRGNEGGNGSYVPLLYSYLADKPFRLAKPTTLASASVSFLPYAEGASEEVKAFAAAPHRFVSQDADGSWVLKEEFDKDRYRVLNPQTDRFVGRLYVLTDGGAFSATNDFLDLVYRYHRTAGRSVRFVGEQNGGDNVFGRVSGGQTLPIVLPNSKQRLSIPLLGSIQHFATTVPKAIIPDHRIRPSIQDVIAGVDRELLFARERIARQRIARQRVQKTRAAW
jgi:hypothetical protein